MFSREFSHTIKHLTLATWTKEEVATVCSGGNKVVIVFLCSFVEGCQEVS